MLKLLSCARGHFWESTAEPTPEAPVHCPECGAPADELPLLDLAPSQITAELPPPVAQPVAPLLTEDGKPNVAGFEILEDLGRAHGRMRRYRARQLGINREVLLEVVLAKEDVGQNAWSALRGEASALGKIDHPNVLHIHDVGERDRQLFYNALELVAGPTLGQKGANKPLPIHQVLHVVELLARAVDHAHGKGILHRNLRPSSVLLLPIEGTKVEAESKDPAGVNCQLHSGFFIPKLTGFGLARKAVEGEAIDADLFGDEIGYLSPEQVWGRARDLGPTTDVYGLGGILYYLLAGRPPYRGPSVPETFDAIQTAPLASPAASRRVPADLEAICRKALTRSPRRRYASAAEMADDLRRVQLGQPIASRKATGAQRVGRWMRRRPGVTLMLLVTLTACVFGLVGFFSEGDADKLRVQLAYTESRLRQVEAEAVRGRRSAAQTAKLQEFLSHKQAIDRAVNLAALANVNQNARNNLLDLLQSVPHDRRHFEWHYLSARANGGGSYEITDFDQDLTALAFGPQNGRTLVTAQPQNLGNRRTHLRVWDVQTRTQSQSWKDEQSGQVLAVALSPDGSRVAAAGHGAPFGGFDGGLNVYRLNFGRAESEWSLAQDVRLTDVGYNPAGDRLVCARANGSATILDPRTRRILTPTFGQQRFVAADSARAAVGPNHVVLYVIGDPEARVYRLNNGAEERLLSGNGTVRAAAAAESNEDGVRSARVAVARSDQSVTVHDLSPGGGEVRLSTAPQSVLRLAFSPDGSRLAAALDDGTVKVWATAAGLWLEILSSLTPSGPGAAVGLAFSSNGRALAVGGGRKVVVWGVVE